MAYKGQQEFGEDRYQLSAWKAFLEERAIMLTKLEEKPARLQRRHGLSRRRLRERKHTPTVSRRWHSVTAKGLASPRPDRGPGPSGISCPLLPSTKLFHISEILPMTVPCAYNSLHSLSNDLTPPARHKSIIIFTVKFSPITPHH